jgi:aspartate carbamoyltransferase catalytic subunit
MPTPKASLKNLFQTAQLSVDQIISILEKAKALKSGQLKPNVKLANDRIVANVFFEPSTRTRFSFEIASQRLGLQTISFTADSSTSITKGESLEETLQTVLAMRPDAVVLRFKGEPAIQQVAAQTQIPIINAGQGTMEHPTQALLDAMTIWERRGQIKDEKILFVGDVTHSRVAASGLLVFSKLGAKVGFCGPKEFLPAAHQWAEVTKFESLQEASSWATVCIGLRVQKERHEKKQVDMSDYIQKFRLDGQNLQNLGSQAVIMHPGPFVADEDLHPDVLNDKRCAIHDQVTNGVYVRMSVLGEIFGLLNS